MSRTGSPTTSSRAWRPPASSTRPGFVHPFGAHAAIVEVDTETGRIEIVRYVAVDDCGTVINPTLVDGQVHGGIVQASRPGPVREGRVRAATASR